MNGLIRRLELARATIIPDDSAAAAAARVITLREDGTVRAGHYPAGNARLHPDPRRGGRRRGDRG